MKIRKLVSCYAPMTEPHKQYIDFAYYDKTNKWTGESESATITKEEFYQALKPLLHYKKERR